MALVPAFEARLRAVLKIVLRQFGSTVTIDCESGPVAEPNLLMLRCNCGPTISSAMTVAATACIQKRGDLAFSTRLPPYTATKPDRYTAAVPLVCHARAAARTAPY